MSSLPGTTLWRTLALSGLLALPCLVTGAETPESPTSGLQACARLSADAERLACYDRLAGRAAPSEGARTAQPKPAIAPTATAAAAAPASATAPAAAAPATPSTQSFGQYAAEHPKAPPVAPSLEAAVAALGRSASGRMTVALEGGGLWELEDPDPLLAVGDRVTITRATFGSYILHTPSQRDHRARRLR